MLFFLLLLIAILSVIYFKLIVPFYYWKRRNIFYITPWASFRKGFLGKTPFIQLVRSAYSDHPDKMYYGSYQFLKPSLFVRDRELIKLITVKDFDHFTDHMGFTSEKTDPILGLNLFSLKGRKWRQMRSTLSPAFTSSKMRAMFQLISNTAKHFTQHFSTKEEPIVVLDMKNLFAKYTNDVIANCAFGIQCDSLLDEDNDFFKMGKYVSTPTPFRMLRTILYGFFPKVFEFFRIPALPNHISDFFLRLIQDTVKVREEEGLLRPDMIHLLMEARKGRLKLDQESGQDAGFATVQESETDQKQDQSIEITDEVITAQALVFFIAGFTTSAAILSFMSYELAINPDLQKRLQKEIDEVTEKTQGNVSYEDILQMKFLDQVVSETLRKFPPGYALNRVCVKDYLLQAKESHEKDTLIEKGCLLAIPVIGLHYDPEFFPDPEKFDPDRFSEENRSKIVPGSYLPFGTGPRNCIGSRFALLEIKALTVHLLSKFEMVPVEKTTIPLEFAKSLNMEVKGGIWLGLKKRL